MSLEKEEAIIKVSEEKACNYVSLGNKVLINLTEDTNTASTTLKGYTGHNAKGEKFVGTYVPTPELQSKTVTITENSITTVTADEGYDGLDSVEVNVEVEMPDEPVLIEKTITENGTYDPASDNADGYSQVNVNVAGGEVYQELPLSYFAIAGDTIKGFSVEGREAINAGEVHDLNIPGSYNKAPDTIIGTETFNTFQEYLNWAMQNPYALQYEYQGKTYTIPGNTWSPEDDQRIRQIINTEGSITITVVEEGEITPGTDNIITTIGSNAFTGSGIASENITKIILSNNITTLNNRSFSFFNKVTKIILSENLIEIPQNAFYIVRSSELFIPASVTSIAEEAFYGMAEELQSIKVDPENTHFTDAGCNVLVDIDNHKILLGCNNSKLDDHPLTYEYGVRRIADGAFAGTAVSFTSMLPVVTEIGSQAFSGCQNISEEIYLNGVERIDGLAFNMCYNLKDIHLGNKLVSLGEGFISGCKSLQHIYYDGDEFAWESLAGGNLAGSLNTLSQFFVVNTTADKQYIKYNEILYEPMQVNYDNASSDNVPVSSTIKQLQDGPYILTTTIDHIISVYIPGSVYKLEGTFNGCEYLTNVDGIQYGLLETIGGNTFYGCRSLTSIILTESVTSIEINAFSESGLTTMELHSKNPPDLGWNALPSISQMQSIIVPQGSLSAYQNATRWSEYASIISEHQEQE